MAVTIADTDVLIDFLSAKGPGADAVANHLRAGDLATTTVSAFELLAGARTARQQKIVGQLLDALSALPFDVPAARRAGEIRRGLEAAGKPIGMGDCMIAGIALANGSALLTRNVKEFSRVPGLHLAPLPRS